jgi:hypothetical protein
MATVLIDTTSTPVYELPLTTYYPLGTYITIQDNGSNPGFFASSVITIKTSSGDKFYDGKVSHYIQSSGGYLTFAAMSKSWRLMNTLAYVTSGNALLSNVSTTHLFSLGAVSLSNLTVDTSFTVTQGMDLQSAPTIEGIPCINSSDIVSTVNGLGSIGYLSSIADMNLALTSTFVGIGGYGYISTTQLQSTLAALGQSYISTSWLTSTFEGLGSLYLSTPSIASTVRNLGTYGYISSASLTSTITGLGGLGTIRYISYPSLFSTVSNIDILTSSNNQSTFAQLGHIYVSSASLVSTVVGLSNIYIVSSNLTSTSAGLSGNYRPATESTITGLGNIGYISSLSLFSTVTSIVLSNQSNVSERLSSLGSTYISSLSLKSTVDGLGNLYISTNQLTSTTLGLMDITSADLASTVEGLGTIYLSTDHLVSTTTGLSDVAALAIVSTVNGLGSLNVSNPYISSASLQSTVAGLGTSRYISLSQLTSTTSNLQTTTSNAIVSTIIGLETLNYISITQLTSTVGSLVELQRSNLISTVNTLGSTELDYPAYISSASLQSTVAGLATFGYISLSQLTSTTSNLRTTGSNEITSTIIGLGTAGYISLAHLTSTVGSLAEVQRSNLISTVNTLGSTELEYPAYISSASLQSTVAGLATFGYISLSQLTSTTSNLQTTGSNVITSTIIGLGTAGYISLAHLTSTVGSLAQIHTSNLISTVDTLGSTELDYPAYISSASLQSTVAGLGTFGYISLSQLTSTTSNIQTTGSNVITSTIIGLGTAKYISLAQITSTVGSLAQIHVSNLISTVDTLGSSNRGTSAYISSASLHSTVAGLGTAKYISLSQLASTTSNIQTTGSNVITSTIIGLGTLKYISLAQITSTVGSLAEVHLSNLISTVDTLGSSNRGTSAYISSTSLQSTVAGLGTAKYISLSQLASTTSNIQTTGSNVITSTIIGLGTLKYISLAQITSTVGSLAQIHLSNLISTVDTLGSSNRGTSAYISSASLHSTVAGLGTAKYISLSQLTSTSSNLLGGVSNVSVSTINGLANLTYISTLSLVSTVLGLSNSYQSNLISTVNTLGALPIGYISTSKFNATLTGWSNSNYVTTVQVDATLTADKVSNSNAQRSTQTGLGTAGYISLEHMKSTVAGFATLNRSNLTSTVDRIGYLPPAYISSASLVSTVTGVNEKLLNLSNLTSTTSNVQLGLYGTTSTFDGLGTSKYISLAQLTSTVTSFSNINQSNLVSMVNSLGSSGYISSLSLQSTVAGLGTAGYISLAQLTSTTASLIVNAEYTGLTITTGLRLWLDGKDPNGDGSSLANGVNVTSWTDKSGYGAPAYASITRDTNVYPTYSSKGIVLNGNNGFITNTGGNLQNQTVFIVFYPSASSFTNQQILVGENSQIAGWAEVIQYKLNGQSNIRIDKGYPTTSEFKLFDIPSLSSNTPYLLCSTVAIGSTDGINVYLNGTASSSGPLGLLTLNGGNTYSIGFANDNGDALYDKYNGTISEVLIYDRILSTAERESVERYLGKKWGIDIPLSPPFISSTSGLAGIVNAQVTTVKDVFIPRVITYTSDLLIYANSNIYTNNYSGTNETTLFTSNVYFRGLACDGKTVYASTAGNKILSISLSTRIASELSPTFNAIYGLCFDSTYSNLYACDFGSGKLQRIEISTLTVTTVGLASSAQYVAIDTLNQYAYVTRLDSFIYKFPLTQGFPIAHTILGTLTIGVGICLDTTKQVAYTANNTGHTISQIDLTTGIHRVFAGTGLEGSQNGPALTASFKYPETIIFNTYDLNLYITDLFNYKIRKITLYTNAYISSFTLQTNVASLGSVPYSYISSQSLISTVNGLGTMYLSTPYLRSTTAGLQDLSNTFTSTTAGLGQIYISTSALKSIAPDTYTVTTFSPYIGVPYALACTSNFIFYGGGGTIYKNTFSGQSQTIFKTSAATLITALACDLSNVYVVPDNVNYILSINIQTANVTFFGNSGNAPGYTDSSDPTLVRFNTINDICMDPTYRYLYICDAGNKRLRRLQFSPFNVSTLVMIDGNIQSLAIDSRSEYIYITYIDSGNNSFIYRHSLLGFSPRLFSTDINGLGLISGISIDTSQNHAYLVPKDLHSVFRINLASGDYSIFVGNQRGYQDGIGLSAKFDNPWGCLYNPYDSCVYIADQSNGYIRKFTTLTYTSTIFGLNAAAIVTTVSASNSTMIQTTTSNFVTSSYPPPLGGYRLWLDGADPNANGIVPALGTSIVRWRDKSGNGYDGVGTGTYSNGITFSGTPSQTGYTSSLPTNIPNQTVFTVFNPTTTNYQYIIGTTGSNSGIQVGINGTMQIDMSYPANTLPPYKTQIVQTLAGVYNDGGSTNGTGSNARFKLPSGMVIDSSGNIYIADYANNLIRKIDSSSNVTTYTGNIDGGFSDGLLASARFFLPIGIAINSSDYLYVAEYANGTVRVITSTTVSLIAGSPQNLAILNGVGTNARFHAITDITIDAAGNQYVVENTCNLIRKIDTVYNVTTFAGTGESGSINSTGLASTFNGPSKITCDTTNNILYVYTSDYLIRKITIPPAYTNITCDINIGGDTVINPLSITNNNTTGDIYFTSLRNSANVYAYNVNNNPKVRRYGTAQFPLVVERPYGLSLINGTLYVADQLRHVIYRVNVNGYYSVIAGGSGSSGSGDGNGTSARFNQPTYLSSWLDRFLFVMDGGNNKIRRIDTGDPNFPVITICTVANMTSMAVSIDGNRIYISTTTMLGYYDVPAAIFRTFVGSVSAGTADGYGTSARFTYIQGITLDSLQNIYVSDSGISVRIISPSGYVQTVVSSLNSPINNNLSQGIYAGSNIAGVSGQSLLIGYTSGSIMSIFPLPQVTTLAGTGSSGSADGQGTAASFSGVGGLAFYSGNIYATDTNNYKIRKITTGGLVTTFAGSTEDTTGSNDGPLSSAKFSYPYGIALYSSNIYITERSANTIRSIQYLPDIVKGGTITPNTNTLFTSVVQMGVYNGVTGYINGTQVSQGFIFNTFIDAGTAHIGYTTYKTASPSTSNFFIGRIQEIIIYNTILTTPQRQSVETYLRNKWLPSLASKSITTTPNIYLSNFSTIISQNLYASNITAATFTAQGGRSSGTPNYGFYYGNGLNLTTVSDYRMKEDIHPIQNALEKVSSMQAVTYKMYRDPSHSWIGYVAQDLEVILPDVVRTDDSPEQWKSIQYTNLPALIIEAVKELNEKYERIKYLLSNTV